MTHISSGDKSSSDDIAAYFHGISKRDFKNAVGSLYKGGKSLEMKSSYGLQLKRSIL